MDPHSKERPVVPIELVVTDSNSMEFPAGSRVPGFTTNGVLVEFAGYEIEDTRRSPDGKYVQIATALGYHFTVRMADYQQITMREEREAFWEDTFGR
jgi:hypothetical protein